jgi:hypothetical protein
MESADMTQEDIIRMAREAGLEEMWELTPRFVEKLEAFAALVAAAEREACAKVCEEIATEDGWEGSYAYRCVEAIRARGQA